MPLEQDKAKALLGWLREKGVRRDCPACGHPEWSVGDIISPPTNPSMGGTVVGGPSFPMVQLICENCNHVMHFATPRTCLSEFPDTV